MNERFSAKVGSILAALFLILSIFALMSLNGTVAWFVNGNSVDSSGMHVKVATEQIVESVEFFPISSISLSGNSEDGFHNTYSFTAEKITDPEKMQLGEFSTLVAKRQLLIKINLHGEKSSATVSAVSEAEDYMIEDANTIVNKTGNSLSSVVEFRVATDVLLQNGEYVISDENIVSTTSFSSVLVEDEETNVSFTKSIDLYSTPQNETDNSIFIIVDYSEKSVEYVIDHVNHLITAGLTDIEAGESINFICDFEIIVS